MSENGSKDVGAGAEPEVGAAEPTAKDVGSADAASKDVTAEDAASKESASKEAASKEAASKDVTTRDVTAADVASKDLSAGGVTGQGGSGAVEKVGETRPGAGKHELASQSRTGMLWTALAVAGVVLVFLLIFVAQNFMSVTVHFLGLQFSLPLGLALLFAAIIGGVLVWLAGTARMIQMRRAAKKARKQS